MATTIMKRIALSNGPDRVLSGKVITLSGSAIGGAVDPCLGLRIHAQPKPKSILASIGTK